MPPERRVSGCASTWRHDSVWDVTRVVCLTSCLKGALIYCYVDTLLIFVQFLCVGNAKLKIVLALTKLEVYFLCDNKYSWFSKYWHSKIGINLLLF